MLTITFQSPDDKTSGDGFSVDVDGVDLAYGILTVYTTEDMDTQLILAEFRLPEMGWRISPEMGLLVQLPELDEHVGERYGRFIIV